MFSSIIAHLINHKTCLPPCQASEYACVNPDVLTRRFRAEAMERFGEEYLAPTRWLCVSYVRSLLDTAMERLLSQGVDPAILIAGQRDSLRRKQKRVTHLIKQTEDNLTGTLEAIVHLEAQGYLCFYYAMDTSRITVWYENPWTGWVAMLEFDVGKNKISERLVTDRYPLALRKMLKKGAC